MSHKSQKPQSKGLCHLVAICLCRNATERCDASTLARREAQRFVGRSTAASGVRILLAACFFFEFISLQDIIWSSLDLANKPRLEDFAQFAVVSRFVLFQSLTACKWTC